MSAITRAKLKKLSVNTKFEDEECLLKALKERNVRFSVNGDEIVIDDPESIKLVKKSASYVVEYEAKTEVVESGYTVQRQGMISKETERGKRMVASRSQEINNFIYNIEEVYDRFLDEKIERLKYEAESLNKIQNEEEERKKRIMRERELKRLEHIKKRREREKRKMIEENTEKLRERAKELGYEIEEQEVNDERILVLVRRR